jgi:hypothetical protein
VFSQQLLHEHGVLFAHILAHQLSQLNTHPNPERTSLSGEETKTQITSSSTYEIMLITKQHQTNKLPSVSRLVAFVERRHTRKNTKVYIKSTVVLKFWNSVLMVVFRPLGEHQNTAVTWNKKNTAMQTKPLN